MSSYQIEISKDEYFNTVVRYWKAVCKLPRDLQEHCPNVEKFLSPANWTNFSQDYIELSLTGTQRYKMLNSPHVVTLLAIYVAKRKEKINDCFHP